jgi:mannose-1-phosphate guanylyltransferase
MQDSAHTWALVLASGDGRRLSELSTDATGRPVPKQYCTLGGGPSLLQAAMQRGSALAGPDRVSVIVAAGHRRWWWRALRDLPARNVIVQPGNRGTANGILLQLLHLERIDPAAEVVLLPSDHLVIDEAVLAEAMRRALLRVRAAPGQIVLLGMTPVAPDPELGYIVPAPPDQQGISAVLRFVEKPTPTAAALLIERGGLLNTFILVARCGTLLEQLTRAQPAVVRAMRSALDTHRNRQAALDELYERLPNLDFSHHVLESAPSTVLHVEAVAACGWSDLGTPERVGQAISMLVHDGHPPAGMGAGTGADVDLSARYLQSLLAAARLLDASARPRGGVA